MARRRKGKGRVLKDGLEYSALVLVAGVGKP